MYIMVERFEKWQILSPCFHGGPNGKRGKKRVVGEEPEKIRGDTEEPDREESRKQSLFIVS